MPELTLEVATGDPLSVRRFVVKEAMSQPFEVSVVARTPDPSLDLESIVGHPATFRVVSGMAGAQQKERRWSGICRFAEQEQAVPAGLSTYRFVIAPSLWLMTQRRDYRILQHRSVLQIAGGILDTWKIVAKVDVDTAAHPLLPYKVQYGETDYAFFCRVLEEAGIAFAFLDDTSGKATLTLSDRMEQGSPRSPVVYAPSPNEAAEQEFVTQVGLVDDSRPGAYTIRDYDMRRPGYRLVGEATKAPAPEDVREQYLYQPGAFLIETTPSGDTPAADAEGAARNDDAEGTRKAQRSLESVRADKRVVTYRTNVIDLWPGRVFTITDHPHPDLSSSQQLLVTDLSFEGGPGEDWTLLGRAVFASTPYHPPLRTPRPKARVQSATVVGQEEIDTDEFGRVRVRFPWDRGEGISCWMRVSHLWAGAGYGMMALPRVGQEVLVDFLEGDPEQPVVVGRVFNQVNPVPERLPEHQTKSLWKSNSSPASAGFNELLFEDKKGSELFYAQAEKDARRLVKHDETATVVHDRKKVVATNELETTNHNRVQETRRDWVELTYGDRTTAVDATRRDRVDHEAIERIETEEQVYVGHDQHVLVTGTRRESVEFTTHLHIGKGRPERVGGTDSLGVHEGFLESVGDYAVIADHPQGWIHHLAGCKIKVESDTEVTYRGGGGFIDIDSSGVTILGERVLINEGGDPADLWGVGPPHPEPPKMALVDEPPPPRDPLPDDPRVTYELTVVDEWESPIRGLSFVVTTPAGTTTETTDETGRIQVDGPPESASAYVQTPADVAGLLSGSEKKARRTTALPEGDPWVLRTPTDLADTIVLPRNKPKKLMVLTRTDLSHFAFASGWTKRSLASSGPYVMESSEPVRVQMQSDATASQAVVVGHPVTAPAGTTGTEKSTGPDHEASPAAPGEIAESGSEWLRAVVDSLHDALFKKAFDVAFSILEAIPIDPPDPPRVQPPDPTAERAAYQSALSELQGQGITDTPYVEDPNEP